MKPESFRSLLGTELPIIQAPMAGVQDSALAISVCAAGGLGSLPCAMFGPDKIASEIKAIRQSTDRPFNLNFFCHSVSDIDELRRQKWQRLLQPYYEELGLQLDPNPAGASRLPFDHTIADVIEPFSPDIISFHFGLPGDDLLSRVKSWGTKIIASATTVKEAQWLEAEGVDAIIAQGLEAGGHRGMFLSQDISTQVGTFALLPQIVKRVSVPVIAAGGIADSQGVRSALALGASAVQIGTAYLLCAEATTSRLHRAALKSDAAQHTELTNLFSGRPARGIVNRLMRDLGSMRDDIPRFPFASIDLLPLRTAAEKLGADDFTSLWSGQNASGCREISATVLTHELTEMLPSRLSGH